MHLLGLPAKGKPNVKMCPLMTRLVDDPLLVTVRESCPQLDDLGHLLLSEVRCLTENQQVSNEVQDFVPPSPFGPMTAP